MDCPNCGGKVFKAELRETRVYEATISDDKRLEKLGELSSINEELISVVCANCLQEVEDVLV